MKIIIKPLTYISVALGLGAVIALLVFQDRPNTVSASMVQKLKGQKTSINEHFDSVFYPVTRVQPTKNLKVEGRIASGWRDWSQAHQGVINYSPVILNQENLLKVQYELQDGDFFVGRELFFEPGQYKIHAQVRSSVRMLVRLGLCHDYKNRTFSASTTKEVGPEWQELVLDTTADRHNYFVLLGSRQTRATLWVRNISIQPL